MPIQLLKSKNDIGRFISEAEECAKQKMGFAAMLTIFPVILAVSEAVNNLLGFPRYSGDRNLLLFKYFVPEMGDKTWLIPRQPTVILSDEVIATELYQIRNGLTHQLSQPIHVGLINTKSEVKEFLKENPSVKHALCVIEFIEVVKTTVDKLIEKYPDAILDGDPRGSPRALSKRVIFNDTSGSPVVERRKLHDSSTNY